MDRKRKLKAVVDTNVLISADRTPLLVNAELGYFELIWSDFIEQEFRRVTKRIGWTTHSTNRLAAKIASVAQSVDYRQVTGGNYEEWLLDVDDHAIMKTALVGKVDYIVTANTKDFPPKKRFAGITIITPDAFLRILHS